MLTSQPAHLMRIATSFFALIAAPCATAGGQVNLIPNGDFSQGNTGFASSYSCCTCQFAGVYDIVSNPNDCHFGFADVGDHTTGDGLLMAVNGADVANVAVWSTAVPVQAGQRYQFSTWLMSCTAAPFAQLQFSINDELVGPVFTAPSTVGVWEQFAFIWCSDDATTATIAVVNQNLEFSGNDFALDDIFFGPGAPGDVDGDGDVDVDDLVAVIEAWGPPPAPCAADVNHDGPVNVDDLVQVIVNWS